ncbi:hypothetical protein CC80DRAFT_202569 [Byssothecium circinans]|uniref:BZIP domain-containing protein n=1 Tax=Byssothecium circinans TaxID=147558 RepID=A0A6A5UCK5_9PLEO|nr:hypothetical protein CC80DRAFT_202569 [Byssothecium circinans]
MDPRSFDDSLSEADNAPELTDSCTTTQSDISRGLSDNDTQAIYSLGPISLSPYSLGPYSHGPYSHARSFQPRCPQPLLPEPLLPEPLLPEPLLPEPLLPEPLLPEPLLSKLLLSQAHNFTQDGEEEPYTEEKVNAWHGEKRLSTLPPVPSLSVASTVSSTISKSMAAPVNAIGSKEAGHITSRGERAENRAAQRSFQERKEQHTRDLEVQISVLSDKYNKLETSHAELVRSYQRLQATIRTLGEEDNDAELNTASMLSTELNLPLSEGDSNEDLDNPSEGSSDVDWMSEGFGPRTPAQELPHDLCPLVSKTAMMLFVAFSAWRHNNGYHVRGGPSESSDGSPSHDSSQATNPPSTSCSLGVSNWGSASASQLGQKRRSDDDEEPPRAQRRAIDSSLGGKFRLLACPFAKRHPLKHRKCFKYTMEEIGRLKQHLKRVHQIPIHCTRCSQTFRTELERDEHLRQTAICEIQPAHNWDGISETQKKQLTKRLSQKKTKEENWYAVYDILFPGERRPTSPYVDHINLSEDMLALREFTLQEAPARIAAFARLQIPENLRNSQELVERFAQAAVHDVFDMVIERWMTGAQACGASPTRTAVDSGYVSGVSRDSNSIPPLQLTATARDLEHNLTTETTSTSADTMAPPLEPFPTALANPIDTLDWFSFDSSEFGFFSTGDAVDDR